MSTLTYWKKSFSAHTDATEIAAEKNKEFLHLPYSITLRATWKCNYLSNSKKQLN